jgi:hypothetical protein
MTVPSDCFRGRRAAEPGVHGWRDGGVLSSSGRAAIENAERGRSSIRHAMCPLRDSGGSGVRRVLSGEHPPLGLRKHPVPLTLSPLRFFAQPGTLMSCARSVALLAMQAQCGYAADSYVECERMVTTPYPLPA